MQKREERNMKLGRIAVLMLLVGLGSAYAAQGNGPTDANGNVGAVLTVNVSVSVTASANVQFASNLDTETWTLPNVSLNSTFRSTVDGAVKPNVNVKNLGGTAVNVGIQVSGSAWVVGAAAAKDTFVVKTLAQDGTTTLTLTTAFQGSNNGSSSPTTNYAELDESGGTTTVTTGKYLDLTTPTAVSRGKRNSGAILVTLTASVAN